MDPTAPLSFKDLFSHIIADMARALCERPNETKQPRFVRVQAVTQMILGLLPRDVIEAMLAGQVVMFHELMTDSIHDTLQGQIDTMRRPTRANIVSLNKAFHMNLEKLAHYQLRPSEGTREATGGNDAPAERAGQAAAVQRPAAEPARTQAAASQSPAPDFQFKPTPEQIAAVQANPEAMTALEAGDAKRFAQAMGVANPGAAYPEAAAGLPSKVPEHMNRQMRRHPR